MNRIILIGCAKTKLDHAAQAQCLYTGCLFRLSLAYARDLSPDAIFILSAMHYLIDLDAEIEPYDMTLMKMSTAQVRAWAEKVIAQLGQRANLKEDRFVVLAGTRYRRYLLPHLPHHKVPLAGLRQGEQLAWLRRHIQP